MRMPRRARALALPCAALLLPLTALAQAPTPPPLPPPIAFQDALLKAANDLFSKADLQGAPQKITLVIDPLIDGVTGAHPLPPKAWKSASPSSSRRTIPASR